MDILNPKVVIGTNSWGSARYEKLMRGSSVGLESFRETVSEAQKCDIALFDTARDYGNGKCPKILGDIDPENIYISSKFTPFRKYKPGRIYKSLEKDLADLHRDYIDVYWLHMPNDIEANLKEIITLYKQGKIKHIGVSNFRLDECKLAKQVLERENIPLYGVQNHYSILCRDWEKNGLLDWCKENNVLFWAWSAIDGGVLAGPMKHSGIFGLMARGKTQKFTPLYKVMKIIGDRHGISLAQVAISYCITKGVVPMCGCRKKTRVDELAKAADIRLTPDEISNIDKTTEAHNLRYMSADIFRFAVRKKQ